MLNNQQISSKGIANQSGLEIFSTVTTYSGHYVNWGDAFSYGSQLGSDPDYTVDNSATDPHTDALINAPATDVGQWYRYHTAAGTNYEVCTAPTSGSGYYTFNGKNSGTGTISYGGMYQKMSLIAGVEYQIEVVTPIDTGTGGLYINTYSPVFEKYRLTSTETLAFPIIRSNIGRITTTFTATTPNDIILLYYTTLETSSTDIKITNISVQEVEDYLIPVYAEDMYGNSHKVLRRNFNSRFNT